MWRTREAVSAVGGDAVEGCEGFGDELLVCEVDPEDVDHYEVSENVVRICRFWSNESPKRG